jgi:subtilisin-like proprotein convertase family protein
MDFVETNAFDGHWMKGVWKLEVRDDRTPPERDDITIWGGWTIEITYLTWAGL